MSYIDKNTLYPVLTHSRSVAHVAYTPVRSVHLAAQDDIATEPSMNFERRINGSLVRLRLGDITDAQVDVIVNAANQYLAGGGGVDGAIHRAGGPEITAACRAIGGCGTGDAVATTAGRLRASRVIHAVAPRWHGGSNGEPELLARAYRRSLEIAVAGGDTTIAFPSLGTGAYGYPLRDASLIALSTVIDFLSHDTAISQVTFFLFTARDLETYQQSMDDLLGP